jgi:hypothetical protein
MAEFRCKVAPRMRVRVTRTGSDVLFEFRGWVDGSWVQGEAGVSKKSEDQVLVLADPLDAVPGRGVEASTEKGLWLGVVDANAWQGEAWPARVTLT